VRLLPWIEPWPTEIELGGLDLVMIREDRHQSNDLLIFVGGSVMGVTCSCETTHVRLETTRWSGRS
jgi:hypothetical protein